MSTTIPAIPAPSIPTLPSIPAVPAPTSPSTSGTPGATVPTDTFVTTAAQYAIAAQPYAPSALGGISSHTAMSGARYNFSRAAGVRASARSYNARSYSARSYGARSSGALRAKAMSNGQSAAFGGILKAVRNSLIFNGIYTLAVNGYERMTGKETTGQAAANVTGDMTVAVAGGAVGGIASAIGTAALGSMGIASLPLTLAGFALGTAGYYLTSYFLRKTTFFQNLTSSVQRMFGS